MGEPGGGVADGVDGAGADVVVLDGRKLGGEDAQAAGGHGGGEGDEAGLVHAEVVDAVEDDEGGGVGLADRRVEACADGAAGEWEGDVGGGDAAGDEPAERGGDGLVGDEIEYGDGLEVGLGCGPCQRCEQDEESCRDDCSRGAPRLGRSGLAAGAEALGEAGCRGWVAAHVLEIEIRE